MKVLIVTIAAVCIASAAACVIVGNWVFDGTVTKKPYEAGLLWDQRHQERRQSGLDVAVKTPGFTTGENTLALEVLEKGKPFKKGAVLVTVSRPSTTAYDRTYTCKMTHGGPWSARVDLPLYGYWDFNIHVTRGASDVAFTKQVFAE